MIVDNYPFNLIQIELVSYILTLADNPDAKLVNKEFLKIMDAPVFPPLMKKLHPFGERIPLPLRQEGESDRDYLLHSVKTIAALQNKYLCQETAGFQKPTPLSEVTATLIKRERTIQYELAHHFYQNVFPDIYNPFLQFVETDSKIVKKYRAETRDQRKMLKVINFTGHKIRRLSPEMAGFTKLAVLYLTDNELTFLPPWIARLKNLQEIHLAQNQFSEFPEVLLKCKKLKIINLSENQLTTIPRDITNLPELKQLMITKNKFPTMLKSRTKAAKELKQTLKILKDQGCVIQK